HYLHGNPLPPRQAAKLVRELALALDAAHKQGVVHGDLRPAKILVGQNSMDGNGQAADDWVVTVADADKAAASQAGNGKAAGPRSSLPPEQRRGKPPAGPAADVFALGAIFYELLTGRPPFRAVTPEDTRAQVVAHEPVPPARLQPTVPRALEII